MVISSNVEEVRPGRGTRRGAPHWATGPPLIDGGGGPVGTRGPLAPCQGQLARSGSGSDSSFSEDRIPVVFSTVADGTACCYIGMRAAPKIA